METFDEEAAIAAWLAAKYRLSNSQRTVNHYRWVMRRFQKFLKEQGLCLDPWAQLPDGASERERRQVLGQFAIKVREFAEKPTYNKPIGSRSFNIYLDVLGSFYQFCNKLDFLACGDPAARVDRAKVTPYGTSRALDIEAVVAAMQTIDREDLEGCRDYALLSALFETGRRIGEVLSMQYKHLTLQNDGRVEVFFPRTKGGKTKRDVLSRATSAALLSWLLAEYGGKIKAGNWIWTNLAKNHRGEHLALCYSGCRKMVERRLGTTQIHRTRHTWVRVMRKLGADLREVQKGLGHSSIITTEIYDQMLEESGNPRIEDLAAVFKFSNS